MTVRERLMKQIASQLGHPRGVAGRVVGRLLNRGNARMIQSAVDALTIPPEAALADIGFGGGAGLDLLLECLDGSGQVHGVDPATEMINVAAKRLEHQVTSGRLRLHKGVMEALPLADTSLDGAITLNTVYFIKDLPAAFAELARVLKSDGQVIVGLGDPVAMARLPFTSDGFTLRPVEEVAAALAIQGFEVEQHDRLGTGKAATHLLRARRIG